MTITLPSITFADLDEILFKDDDPEGCEEEIDESIFDEFEEV